MTKYQIGDILIEHVTADTDYYYLIEDIKEKFVVGNYTVYSFRNLISNTLHEINTATLDELDSIEKVA